MEHQQRVWLVLSTIFTRTATTCTTNRTTSKQEGEQEPKSQQYANLKKEWIQKQEEVQEVMFQNFKSIH